MGQGARAEIERFVRERLPRGGALAYVPAELMSLNARRASQSEFRPYSHAIRREGSLLGRSAEVTHRRSREVSPLWIVWIAPIGETDGC